MNSLDSSLKSATEQERRRIAELLQQLEEAEESPSGKRKQPVGESGETIAKTRAEAARLLGVHVRTFAEWMGLDGFPGRSGNAFDRNGHFPVEAIKRWRAEVLGARSLAGSALTTDDAKWRSRKLAAEAVKREIEVEKECGRLIDRETHLGTVVAALSAARSIAEEFPDRVVAYLPADRKKTRRIWRREAMKLVRSLLEAMADAVVNEDDDEDGDDDRQGRSGVDRRSPQAGEPSGEASAPVGDAGRTSPESPSTA